MTLASEREPHARDAIRRKIFLPRMSIPHRFVRRVIGGVRIARRVPFFDPIIH
ncbi:hypothetical protein [Burkholderia stagnalis]|uniref:hypothetical protein n=1 Tax=Burkholderia stagnalis TaxID=1503054 RepID=UPI0012FE7169|nr:hypothetical protein [Burkholderia stagnalis]